MAHAFWERSTLEAFFKDNWTQTPIKWENTPFTIPRVNGNGAYLPYVAFFLRSGTGNTVSLGSMLQQRQASLAVILGFVPELTGKLDSLTYTDALLDLWVPRDFLEPVTENIIRTRPPYPNTVGAVSGWYQTNVFVPYILDTLVPNH